MPTHSSKLGGEIEKIIVLRVQLEQLGASAVRSPLPTDCRLQETSDEVSGPVRTGEVLDDPANAPCERGNYIKVLGASAEPRPLLMDCRRRRLRSRAL